MHKALYRKWRPKTFDEMVGQDHVVAVLKNQCRTGKTSHAYLFCGSRGTGKTSAAKILAKAVNCLQPKDGNPCGECENCLLVDSGAATDISEIDAASNNSVENVRDLRDEVLYSPAALLKRVYIIDEVHMLSASAFNALLKTLEEPPENVVFILATTELNKIPPTILSRCQRFEFRRIEQNVISERLNFVAEREGIKLTPEASELIARLADGGMRDALSMLESCAGGAEDELLSLEFVQDRLGVAGADAALSMLEKARERDVSACISQISILHSSAKDLNSFLMDLLRLVRDMMIYSKTKKADLVSTYLSKQDMKRLAELSKAYTVDELMYFASVLEDTYNRLTRYSPNKRFELEMVAIKLCDPSLDSSTDALAARVAKLEAKIESGVVATKPNADVTATQSVSLEHKSDKESTDRIADEDVPPWEVSKTQKTETVIQKPKDEKINSKSVSDNKQSETKENQEKNNNSPDVSAFLSEIKREPQISSFVESSDLSLNNGELIVACSDDFIVSLLKQDVSQKKLQSALERAYGGAYKIRIIKKKEGEQVEKSPLDDIMIFD